MNDMGTHPDNDKTERTIILSRRRKTVQFVGGFSTRHTRIYRPTPASWARLTRFIDRFRFTHWMRPINTGLNGPEKHRVIGMVPPCGRSWRRRLDAEGWWIY